MILIKNKTKRNTLNTLQALACWGRWSDPLQLLGTPNSARDVFQNKDSWIQWKHLPVEGDSQIHYNYLESQTIQEMCSKTKTFEYIETRFKWHLSNKINHIFKDKNRNPSIELIISLHHVIKRVLKMLKVLTQKNTLRNTTKSS